MSKKWHDLQERIATSPSRSEPPRRDDQKPRSKRFLTPDDTAIIVERYETGNTTADIGRHYGMSKTRVATILREHGVVIRRKGMTADQAREAVELYAGGKSLAWIGDRLGVSHTTVAAALRTQGVRLRPRPGWGQNSQG